MAKNYVKLRIPVFDELASDLQYLAGDAEGVKQCVEKAFKECSETSNKEALNALQKSNLPAKGVYSTGKSIEAIHAYESKWEGTVGECVIGFDRNVSLTPAYLMHGCPNFSPVKGLKESMTLTSKKKRSVNKSLKNNLIREMKERGIM